MLEQSPPERMRRLEADNARLRHLLAQQGMRAELRHQVRNTLTMVRSILRRSAEQSAGVDDYVAHLEGRLDSILRVQAAIGDSPDKGLDLHSLIADELLVHLAREGEQVQITGPDLKLQPKAAELLALSFHELATNAVKFGALTEPEGRIVVSWTVSTKDGQAPHVTLEWRETGVAIAAASSQSGFGRDVLERMLPYQLDAEASLDLPPTGLRCVIRFPLPTEIGTEDSGRETVRGAGGGS